MHGGSRRGSRGQAGNRGSGPRGGLPRSGPGKSAGKAGAGSAALDRTGAAKPPVSLPDSDRVARLLEPVVHAMGMDLESVRVTAAGRRRLLRVIIDADGGVNLDAIALASRELSARLDGATIMGDMPYTLEVSSPGVDRPLTEPRHWRRAVGRLVVAPLTGQPSRHHAGSGSASVEGRIVGASESGVTLDCDGEMREYGYGELGPGRVQVEFGRLEADQPDDEADDDVSVLREQFDEDLDDEFDDEFDDDQDEVE